MDYTIKEAAAKLALNPKTLRRWEQAGRFRASRTLGGQRRYSLLDLQILDALKHGLIERQSDLLDVTSAAKLCGVSESTLTRWESEGLIHSLATSSGTFYPRARLLAQLASRTHPTPPPTITLTPPSSVSPSPHPHDHLILILENTLITLTILLLYHLLSNL